METKTNTGRLITPSLEKTLRNYPLYSQDGRKKDALCIAQLGLGNIRWYILEGQTCENDPVLYGIVAGLIETEYGYFSIPELESITYDATAYGLGELQITPIEDFTPCPLSDIADPRLQEFLSRLYDTKTEEQ